MPEGVSKNPSIIPFFDRLSNQAKIELAFVSMIIVFFLIIGIYAGGYVANRHRIQDIQSSRVYSCQKTYLGIQEAFKPFLPKGDVTQKQQRDIDKFNHNIDRLVLNCSSQIKAGNEPATPSKEESEDPAP